ncbi:MAG: DUF1269 domain-containing protein [Dehalococcoidia bacterium]|nr:DUF1269 domain-containing protein [Dehalococcoidia bacterium]
MADHSVIGVYATLQDAEHAVQMLQRDGFPSAQISIAGPDDHPDRAADGFDSLGHVVRVGAGTGAAVGGLFGVVMGAAFVFVPGLGPLVVAGPLAAAIIGGLQGVALGAAGGGILGALVGWGVTHDRIVAYEEHLSGGKFLVIAHGARAEVERARDILAVSAPDLTLHAPDAASHRDTE